MMLTALILISALQHSMGKAEVRVRVGAPLRFQDSETRTKTTTVITGPGGTRKIVTDENARESELPTTRTYDAESDTEVTGVENPGITYERRVYYPGRAEPVVVGPGSNVKGGPGSIRTKTESKTRTTPPVQVEVH